MDIIMPVAGLGTRLRPQTWSKPKPLVSVAGKPMLGHVLDRVLPLDPDRLIFITGFLGDQIQTWVKDNYGIPAEFVEQPEMLGQTDAILRTRPLHPEDALILFPDMIFDADFSTIDSTDADAIMFTKEVDDPSALGVAVVEDGRIVKLVEKPSEPISNLAVIGIYYIRTMADLYSAMEEQIERKLSLKQEYFIADALQIMIDRGKKVVPSLVTAWEDCGNEQALLATNRFLLDRMKSAPASREGSVVISPSAIHPEAIVEHAVIGPYASVGRGAVVRHAIVRDAILEDGAEVDSAVVERSILGRGAKVSGNPVSLNLADLSAIRI